MTSERMIPTFDGTKLYLKTDMPDNPRATVIIVHGICEHQGRYDHVTAALNAAGYGVYRFDHRGHGRSEGKRVFFSSFDDLPDDLKVISDLVHSEQPSGKVFILGHSMGGLCATLFATKYPGVADGFILSGALTRYNNRLFGDEPITVPPDTYVPNELGGGVCSDPEVVRAYGADPYVEKQISVSFALMTPGAISYLVENAASFVEPALILHGANDGLVSEKDSRDLFGEIGSDDKTLHIYAKLFHEILNEPSKDAILQEIVAWLDLRA